jgi:hypothetical protein
MFLDGMGDQLSGLQAKDEASCDDHSQGYPLDGVEDPGVGEGLAEEGEEKLHSACCGEGEGQGVAGVLAARELAQEHECEKCCRECCIESYRVQWSTAGGDSHAPREGCGEASVTAFGEVSEGEEGPGESRAGGPGIEGVEEWKVLQAEIDRGGEDGEEDAGGAE